MFFNSSNPIIYFKKDSLQFLYKSRDETLKFPPEVISHLEILDLTKLKNLVNEFFAKQEIKNPVIIVLSNDVLFQKTITKDEESESKTEQFIESAPFSKEKKAVKKLAGKEDTTIFVTNKDFFLIGSFLKDKGIEVKAIVPLSAFPVDGIDISTAKKISSNKKLLEASNFLTDSDGKNEESIFQKSFHPLLLVLIGLIIIMLALGSAYVAGLIKNPFTKTKETTATKTITQEASTSATEKEASQSADLKKDLAIQILNGSGTLGQAGKLKKDLEGLGYSNIETGNAEEELEKTVLVFTTNVSDVIKTEILDQLKKDFEVAEEEASESAEFDILITTGKNTSQ